MNPYFSSLRANYVVSKFTADNNSALCVTIWSICV